MSEEKNTPQEPEETKHEGPVAILKKAYIKAIEDSKDVAFSLPSVPLSTFFKLMEEYENMNIDLNDETIARWAEVLKESAEHYTPDVKRKGLYENSLNRDNAEYYQGVYDKASDVLKGIEDVKTKRVEGEIKGEVALLKVTKLLGLGDILQVPLPHTGIWVSIKPPTEKTLIDFYNNLFRDKAMLGRATAGFTLSNLSVYVNDKLFDLVVKHIHSTSNRDIPPEKLKELMFVQDLPILFWGFASTIYTNGFDFARACTSDPTECTHVVEGRIDPKSLLWIDNSALSDAQKNILFSSKANSLTLEHYRKYLAESKTPFIKQVTHKDIVFKLRTPTVEQHFHDGFSWVNKVNQAIDKVIYDDDIEDTPEEEKRRAEMLADHVRISALRMYSHYIDEIGLEDATITDRETIDMVLDELSADDDIRTNLINDINKYIEDTTIALIGVPSYECPKCGKEQVEEGAKYTSVIPVDTVKLFFGLITLRVAKIKNRTI